MVELDSLKKAALLVTICSLDRFVKGKEDRKMWPDEKEKIFKEEAFVPFDEQAKDFKKMFENLKDIKKVIVDYVKEKDLTVRQVRELSSFVRSLAVPATSRTGQLKVKDFLK